MSLINSYIFEAPFACMLAGPSRSGKTTLLVAILQHNRKLIYPPPDRIVYCYSRDQPAFKNLEGIEFKQGLPDMDEFNPSQNNLVILDDLMDECEKDKTILNLFTVDSHHKNISTFFLSQNLFFHGKYSRTISLNCNYLIIFNNPRDRAQINYLARQMYPKNTHFLIECYQDAVNNKKYGYLFVDLTQNINDKFRIQTNILPNEKRIIYQEKNNF